MLLEEYEEEINKLKTLLMKKDDELNNLMQNQKKMQKNINKNYRKQKD
jgi:succinate dehydrogenase flavin-adding protein (antitoxin of CptAB toxin-antitoxin module)